MTDRSVLGSSAVMAGGTVVSRMSGYVRSMLLVAALGQALHADVFSIANTLPNMLYILLAGGVFNAVLVPQLVRAGRNDPDGGEAYTNRIVTLAGLFLGGVTVLLVLAAPWMLHLYVDGAYSTPELAAQRESLIDLTRYCLPQVFFYGMYVLVGQILNARGSFGPMMWAPIANNVIAIGVLVGYLASFGTAEDDLCGPFSTNQELLLGVGSTVGIALQFLILVPYLHKAGFHFRPRFDFRGTGLGHTFRLAVWTVLFVIVNQVAYLVVVKLASGGTAAAALSGDCGASGDQGTGYTVYSGAFLLAMVPHSIVTVSLATAILPRMAAYARDDDHRALAGTLTSTMRTALALVIPFAAMLPLVATDVAQLVFGFGAGENTYANFAPSLALFGVGLVFFTIHYLVLRGFYALERNRTVFQIQCVVAAVNIVAAIALVALTSAQQTAPALVVSYSLAYAAGAAVSYVVLARSLGGLHTARLVRFLVRALIAAAIAALTMVLALWVIGQVLEGDGKIVALVQLGLAGTLGGLAYVAAARAMRITEITELVRLVTTRLPGGR